MSVVGAWLFFVIVTAIILFVAGAKTTEVRQRNDELIRTLMNLVNKVEDEVQFTDQSKELTESLDDARQLCVAYDEAGITLTS